METDWIFRVGDGNNFITSSKYKIWGINSSTANGKHFVKNVKNDDRLWFVKSGSGGKIIAVSSYESHNKRELGPLVNITMTDEELGWMGESWSKCDTEIHYSNLYNLNDCDLLTNIKGASVIRKYNDKCLLNLPLEYEYINKYSKIKTSI
jgi:hypothetical protein